MAAGLGIMECVLRPVAIYRLSFTLFLPSLLRVAGSGAFDLSLSGGIRADSRFLDAVILVTLVKSYPKES